MAGQQAPFPLPSPALVGPAWFCVRSQLKREHLAAAHLASDLNLQVFLPRIRFRRLTRQGSRRVIEPLFPAYLFARFDWTEQLRAVQHARGVAQVVHFGERWPTLPDQTIELLRAEVGGEEIHEVSEQLQTGDEVQLVGGALHGLSAVVSRLLPARQRVAVLLEFLGRQVQVELDQDRVLTDRVRRI